MTDAPIRPTVRFEILSNDHDREGFRCGSDELDRYLRTQARQDARKRVAAVLILTPDGRTVAGFYTLSQYSVELDELPETMARRLPRYPVVPATLIGRLALSLAYRGQGLGEILLMDALKRALAGSRQIASAAIVVDAKDTAAASFYEKYGFLRLPKIARRLFLPMGTVEELFR